MLDRYSRQIIFPEIGKKGQEKLAASSVVIVGCGALGTVIATTLVRAGVGKVRIIDRDFIEYHNLQRQVIFDEDDVKNGLPKAIAAERHLRKVNSSIEIEGIVTDVNYANIEKLTAGADLIMDGLDNLETRFLINDISVKHGIPWVYGGAVSASGMTMTVLPGKTPCFRCVFPSLTHQRVAHTCDTAGVIAPAPFVIGSLQSVEALKILTGSGEVSPGVLVVDVWQGTFIRIKVGPRADCPTCQGKYEFLEGKFGVRTTTLCGQNAIQVADPQSAGLNLSELAIRLEALGKVSYNQHMLRFTVDGQEMVIFPDGRAIVRNTTDEALARGLYAKYIGA